jgi:hypothetical protein
METAFDTSDPTAAWHWKTAYDACEAATALFLRKLRAGHARQGRLVRRLLPMLAKIATHTLCSEEWQALQQFPTPLPLGSRTIWTSPKPR